MSSVEVAQANIAPVADLQLDGVSKSFAERGHVLQGVRLRVESGQSVAIVGANGCGKSTLLRCCLRLVEPDDGTLHLLGEDVRSLDARALRSLRARVGFVFQRHHLVGRLSSLSNTLHGAFARSQSPRNWLQSLARKQDRELAMHCLARVGLADAALRRADQLSGGESQRVAIARVLMQQPKLVMADEPVASLDPRIGEEVMQLFVELMRSHDLTFLFVSHDLDQALRYADRVIGLRHGRVAIDAPAKELAPADLQEVYRA